MKKLSGIAFALSFLVAIPAYAQSNKDVLNSYLTVKNDLVHGDAAKTTQDISAFKKALSGSNAEKNTALVKAIDKMAKANSIDRQRKDFEEVSTLLWTALKNDESIDQPVYYQYCPMKKAYWISADESIKNPYYGKQMLTCGKTVEKIGKK